MLRRIPKACHSYLIRLEEQNLMVDITSRATAVLGLGTERERESILFHPFDVKVRTERTREDGNENTRTKSRQQKKYVDIVSFCSLILSGDKSHRQGCYTLSIAHFSALPIAMARVWYTGIYTPLTSKPPDFVVPP